VIDPFAVLMLVMAGEMANGGEWLLIVLALAVPAWLLMEWWA
jgi:hypothetical protein